MQTAHLKYDIISWITELNDENLINQLHQLTLQQPVAITANGIVPPKRKGSLTEGYGFWVTDAPFDETNYRNKLWETARNVW